MAKLSEHRSKRLTKLLFLGDSGSGKTGALASLVKAGYNVRIADFDDGLDILLHVLNTQEKERVDYETFLDEFVNVNGRIVCKRATAFARALNYISNWPGFGSLDKWTEKDILVLDSITFMGQAAMRYVAQLNGRQGQAPYQSDYLEGQRLVDNVFNLLHDPAVGCNVICISHVREVSKYEQKMVQNAQGKDQVLRVPIQGSEKGYAETGTGTALSPTVGRHFNAVLLAETMGEGSATRREIHTVPHSNVGLKNPLPGVIPNRLPLETGLATYFAALRKEN